MSSVGSVICRSTLLWGAARCRWTSRCHGVRENFVGTDYNSSGSLEILNSCAMPITAVWVYRRMSVNDGFFCVRYEHDACRILSSHLPNRHIAKIESAIR
jgi:hypothetical protein